MVKEREDRIAVLGEKLSHCHIGLLFLKGKYSLHILNVEKNTVKL
jgi:hypothetical protein